VPGAGDLMGAHDFSARWTADLVTSQSGRYTFKLVNTGTCRLYVDGKRILENARPSGPAVMMVAEASAVLDLVAGRRYGIKVEYTRPAGEVFALMRVAFAFTPTAEDDDRLARAVALAKKSDVAVIFAGMPEGFESEGHDRPNMDLPGHQLELIKAVAQANPRTVVVLNAGSPVAMPWLADVKAVVEAYYPGQEGGAAVANVLLGEVNPSGKLTVSFPRQLEDTPAYVNFPGTKEVLYGEGPFVGYRYYDQKKIDPLFPFGHGLSYTTFEYGKVQVPARAAIGDPVQVALTVKNTGPVAGKEVVQVYVHDAESALSRPPKELKGFAKVMLQPGESKTVTFTLDRRAFAFYDPNQKQWRVEPGRFDILVGSSSRDIRAVGTITLEE
ncbi:MAG TPA: glycoside hydrolase family 3 C-terminal domain-containing protein, partial [Aggregatilineales bacterium]|nr:glycoside hydrolase family 3 C-terminal domain-containing protein [Aggregatilineales bacterium]